MRFLVTAEQQSAPPPELALRLMEGMKQWTNGLIQSGKAEAMFAFAGLNGGGGIVNVDSHEELDQIMAGFPFGPFSKVEVRALSDMNANIEAAMNAIRQMTPQR